jgi:hypothetical protein
MAKREFKGTSNAKQTDAFPDGAPAGLSTGTGGATFGVLSNH